MELTGLGSNSFLLESDCAPRAGSQWEEGRETSPRFPVGDPVSVSSCEDHRGSACWFFSSELIVKTGCSVTCLQSWPLLWMGLVLHQTGDMTAWTQQETGVLLAPKPGPGVETPSLGWTRQALVTIQTRMGCLDFEKFRSFGLQDYKDS